MSFYSCYGEYFNNYKPNSLYWGLGIENEVYLEFEKKYEEAIPYAVKAVLTSVELKFMIGATAKNLKQAAQGDPLAAGLTALVYMSYAPQVIEYLSSIGNTFSFILTGAKANNIEGASQLQSTLKDL